MSSKLERCTQFDTGPGPVFLMEVRQCAGKSDINIDSKISVPRAAIPNERLHDSCRTHVTVNWS